MFPGTSLSYQWVGLLQRNFFWKDGKLIEGLPCNRGTCGLWGVDGFCQISFIDYDDCGFGCCRCHELDVIKNFMFHFIHISLFNNKTSVFGPQSGSNPLLHYNHINT
jgi:hypothetical protein